MMYLQIMVFRRPWIEHDSLVKSFYPRKTGALDERDWEEDEGK